jgi:hypothetical protein
MNETELSSWSVKFGQLAGWSRALSVSSGINEANEMPRGVRWGGKEKHTGVDDEALMSPYWQEMALRRRNAD